MNKDVIKDKENLQKKSLNLNVNIKIDDGKNKIDKIIDEFAESERLKEGVNKVKDGVITTTKISFSLFIIGFVLLIILVAAGIVS